MSGIWVTFDYRLFVRHCSQPFPNDTKTDENRKMVLMNVQCELKEFLQPFKPQRLTIFICRIIPMCTSCDIAQRSVDCVCVCVCVYQLSSACDWGKKQCKHKTISDPFLLLGNWENERSGCVYNFINNPIDRKIAEYYFIRKTYWSAAATTIVAGKQLNRYKIYIFVWIWLNSV